MSYREKYFKYKYKYLKEKKDNKKSSSNRKKYQKIKLRMFHKKLLIKCQL